MTTAGTQASIQLLSKAAKQLGYFCDALPACWEEILLFLNEERVDTFGHFSK